MNYPRSPFPLLVLALASTVVFAGAPARADELLRRAQQALHEQGFYYGSVDGASGDETTQAIRRFQIRNGLAVTGKLDDETSRALHLGGGSNSRPNTVSSAAATPPARRPNTPPPIISGRSESGADATPPPLATPPPVAPRQSHPAPTTTPSRPDLRAVPPPPSPQAPPGSVLPSLSLQEFFANTPFEFAPPPVQSDIVRRAQLALRREGFYLGDVDGAPGSQTVAALSEFQSAMRMRRTGRLDEATLRMLRLLPPSNRRRGPQPFFDNEQPPASRRSPAVYEGRIVN